MLGSCVISTSVAPSDASSVQQLDHVAAGGLVEIAGRLVGEDDPRPPRDRTRDRDPLALPARELPGLELEPVREPDPLERDPRSLPAHGRSGSPVYSIPSATLSVALIASCRWNSWKTNPISCARSPASSTSDALPTSWPATLHPAAARSLERAHDRQQRRLARPRRADHRHLIAIGDLDA